LPTERKVQRVKEIQDWLERCTVAISADNTGMGVGAMTDLRRALREKGVQFTVIKNSLAWLAADAAGKPLFREIIEGPTGLAFGYGDPAEPAKALSEHLRSTRAPMKIRGAVMGDRALTAQQVEQLANLPSRDELVARLLGQMQGPIAGLAHVLNGPVSGLARVFQAHIDATAQPEPAAE
jgi:large subunit ribosomal protein L10